MGTNIYLRKVSSKDDLDSFKAKLKANADAADSEPIEAELIIKN